MVERPVVDVGARFREKGNETPIQMIEVERIWIDEDGFPQVVIRQYTEEYPSAHTSAGHVDGYDRERTVAYTDVIERVRNDEIEKM